MVETSCLRTENVSLIPPIVVSSEHDVNLCKACLLTSSHVKTECVKWTYNIRANFIAIDINRNAKKELIAARELHNSDLSCCLVDFKAFMRRWPTEPDSFLPQKGYSGSKGDYFSFSHSLSICRKCSLWWRIIAELLLNYPFWQTGGFQSYSLPHSSVLPSCNIMGRKSQSCVGHRC